MHTICFIYKIRMTNIAENWANAIIKHIEAVHRKSDNLTAGTI